MTQLATSADIGKLVRYYSNGWHFATLLELGRKWARVQGKKFNAKHPRKTGPKRVNAADVQSLEDWLN